MAVYKLKPALKNYIWGGTRLSDEWGKADKGTKVAESWELSFHPDGYSVIDGGVSDGKTLTEVIGRDMSLLGERCRAFDDFPLLVKLIDAEQNLSVQVHPSDEYALKNEGQYGKTEMWYVLDAVEGAGIYWGFRRDITVEEFLGAAEDGSIEKELYFAPAKSGDVFFIEAGTVHAICKGLTIAEIQQNSNITYRVYDYKRVGADGKPRDLHTAKAAQVSTLKPVDRSLNKVEDIGDGLTQLAKCKYFSVTKVEITSEYRCAVGESFVSVLVTDGEVLLSAGGRSVQLNKGNTAFVTADETELVLKGDAEVLLITV